MKKVALGGAGEPQDWLILTTTGAQAEARPAKSCCAPPLLLLNSHLPCHSGEEKVVLGCAIVVLKWQGFYLGELSSFSFKILRKMVVPYHVVSASGNSASQLCLLPRMGAPGNLGSYFTRRIVGTNCTH